MVKALLTFICGVMIFAAAPSPAHAIGEAADLDGKTYTGEYGEKGAKGEGTDEFSFAHGKFVSGANEKFGFGEAFYSAMNLGDQTLFKAEASKDQEKINWAGRIAGEEMSGIFTLRKEGREPKEYWFKGTLKKS